MKKSALYASFLILSIFSTLSFGATFKIATLTPDGSAWMKEMRAGAKEIKQLTEQRVKFKFYPGGVMGDDKAILKKIRIRQLQGGALMGGSLAKFHKDSQIYNVPLQFRNFAEVDYVRAKMDQSIMEGIEKGGFVTFGLAEGGFAYTMSKAPLTSSPDLIQRKVWVPNDDKAALEITRAYGITPIPLALPDVLAGLQTGVINTVATSPIGALALQWHTQVSDITDVPLMYFYATLAIEKKAFFKLSSADQATVREVMGETFKRIDKQNRKDNVAAMSALQNQGITLSKPNEVELELWYAKANTAKQRLIDAKEISTQTMQIFEDHLEIFRKQQAVMH